MIRINLLPYRAEQRRARQQRFFIEAGSAFGIGLLLILLVHLVIESRIDRQNHRNQYLQEQIAILDTQIADLHKLREQTNALLSRKTVVEGLQDTRSDVVHLLDQMLRILPDGVYLKSIKQNGDQISLSGYAQSNARVSSLMRAIEDSHWLESATLVDIHSVIANNARVNEFALTFRIVRQSPQEGGKS